MVLAHLFMQAGIDTAFAHCNFGLRGEESNADEMFLKNFAIKHNHQIYIGKLDAKAHATQHKISIQMAARDLRYGWFENILQTTDYELYATAHHFDDQVETFFINLLRGTGINGLTGIPARNGNCIRPLLFADRNMIRNYAKKNKIDFREDSSNKSDNYLRNRIRHWVLPVLEKAGGNYKSGLENTFNAMISSRKFIDNQMDLIKAGIMKQLDDYIYINIDGLSKTSEPAFVLFELIRAYNFNFPAARDIIAGLKKTPGKRFYSPTHELVIDRSHLIISVIRNVENLSCEIPEDISEINTPVNIHVSKFCYMGQSIPKKATFAWLDFDKLNFPIEIRNYREGDYFHPLGMQGRKKLSNFFIDEKISIPQKRKTYVLVSGGQIAWIIGHRIDNRFKITMNTRTVYALEIIFKPF